MAANNLFRKSVLDKLSSPEQLDLTLTVVKPSGWVALGAIGVLLVAVLVWGIFGSIPEKVNGSGLIMNSGGLVSITYGSGGVIRNVFLEPGSTVRVGQIIARIERQDLLEQVQAAAQHLSNLQQNYESTANLTARTTGLSNEMMSKSERDLREQIATLTSQIQDSQRQEQGMKSLYEEGLITETSYLSTRNQLLTLQKQKQDLEQQLLNVGVNRVKSSGETSQQLLSLQHQIDEARKQLEVQQASYNEATCIISNVTGKVYEVSIASGGYVSPGATIAVIEPYRSDGVSLQSTVYFSVRDGKRIKRGMNIAISPSTVKQEEYGYIQGIVTSVSAYPVTSMFLQTSLQNTTMAQKFIEELGTPIEVKVSLIPDPSTKTGFRWSSSKGPDSTLETGIMCTGAVTIRSQRPIELVIPIIKKKLFGIGVGA
ncbi:MAG: NHLP bacteriocin system secretion protein [Treponema sp.]|nr:NHLP bacteriocin system secretion protein [Treponema sp.]